MRFLLDAGLPRACADLLRTKGDMVDVRDLRIERDDRAIAAFSQRDQRCLLTRDGDFGDVRAYPPDHYAGIVVFRFEPRAGREFILGVVAEFASAEEVLTMIPGRLAIVSADRIRLRPPPNEGVSRQE